MGDEVIVLRLSVQFPASLHLFSDRSADQRRSPFRHQRERRRRSRRSLAPAIPPPTQFTVTTSNPYAVLGQDKQPDKEVTAPADSAAAVKQPDTQQVQLGATVQPVARQPDKQPTGTAGPVAGPVDGLAALRMIDARFACCCQGWKHSSLDAEHASSVERVAHFSELRGGLSIFLESLSAPWWLRPMLR